MRDIGPNETDPQLRAIWARREAIRVRLQELKDDADHWNALHPSEPPIVVDMDLTADVAARRAADTPTGA